MIDSLYDLGWMSILLHVCRRWKNVALANPAIWSYVSSPVNRLIPMGRPRKTDKLCPATAAQLRRSGAHPLSFKLTDFQSKGAYEVFNALIPHLDRVCHFEVAIEADVLADFVAGLGRSRRPGLRHLRLESISPTAYSLPDDAGQNILIDLHTLVLNNVAANWASIRNIVCLDITRGASQGRPLGVSVLVGLLQACPMLEDLSLVECVSGDDALHESVGLPQLRKLHVCDASSICKTVVDVVQPSPLAAISIYATDIHRAANIKSLLGKSLRDWARASPPFRAIEVATRSSYARFIDGYETLFFTDSATLQGSREAFRQSAHLLLRTYPRNVRGLRSVTRKILRAVPTKAVNDLDLRFSAPLPKGTCRALLDALPALCSLKFPARGVAESFLRRLGTLVQFGSLQVMTGPYKEPLAVPALEQITIDELLDEYHETEIAIGRKLLAMLEGYAKVGRRIQQVVFENGGLAMTQEMQLVSSTIVISDVIFPNMRGGGLQSFAMSL
ncbi:uncharacterized protein SCHCODRAFT_02572229 [Schizophyllum commune H4-8]|nr:uncharacterized protein SCHCODRAFT_02572229 [Schizophyllum commune H4-8]KAI5895077.1 hypothetical protein SCHCODRAFT_02572229 [Schizophyllum commune H4-8]